MNNDTEKTFKEFQKFLADKNIEPSNPADIMKYFDEFAAEYNLSVASPKQSNSPMDVYDCMDLAYNADSPEEALKYAKKALKLDKDFLDAEVMIAELTAKSEDDLQKKYEKLIKKEEESLKEKGFFEEDCIGDFWLILDTRPYMRLRAAYNDLLIHLGKRRRAIVECEDLLRLCEGDNLGTRYKLMHLYAFYDDEINAIKLHKKFQDDNTMMLLPLICLYYKLDNYISARKYLKQLCTENPEAKKFFLKPEKYDVDEILDGIAEFGAIEYNSADEVIAAMAENSYLYITAEGLMPWIAEAVRKLK